MQFGPITATPATGWAPAADGIPEESRAYTLWTGEHGTWNSTRPGEPSSMLGATPILHLDMTRYTGGGILYDKQHQRFLVIQRAIEDTLWQRIRYSHALFLMMTPEKTATRIHSFSAVDGSHSGYTEFQAAFDPVDISPDGTLVSGMADTPLNQRIYSSRPQGAGSGYPALMIQNAPLMQGLVMDRETGDVYKTPFLCSRIVFEDNDTVIAVRQFSFLRYHLDSGEIEGPFLPLDREKRFPRYETQHAEVRQSPRALYIPVYNPNLGKGDSLLRLSLDGTLDSKQYEFPGDSKVYNVNRLTSARFSVEENILILDPWSQNQQGPSERSFVFFDLENEEIIRRFTDDRLIFVHFVAPDKVRLVWHTGTETHIYHRQTSQEQIDQIVPLEDILSGKEIEYPAKLPAEENTQ